MITGIDPAESRFGKREANEADRLLEPLEREFGERVKSNESLALESVYTRYGNNRWTCAGGQLPFRTDVVERLRPPARTRGGNALAGVLDNEQVRGGSSSMLAQRHNTGRARPRTPRR